MEIIHFVPNSMDKMREFLYSVDKECIDQELEERLGRYCYKKRCSNMVRIKFSSELGLKQINNYINNYLEDRNIQTIKIEISDNVRLLEILSFWERSNCVIKDFCIETSNCQCISTASNFESIVSYISSPIAYRAAKIGLLLHYKNGSMIDLTEIPYSFNDEPLDKSFDIVLKYNQVVLECFANGVYGPKFSDFLKGNV